MSRVLFLLLLLTNLGVLAWVRLYRVPGDAGLTPSPPPGGQPLQLMSELTPKERAGLAHVTESAPPAATATVAAAPALSTVPGSIPGVMPVLTCVSYGPFPSADAVGQGVTRLKTAGLSASQRTVPGKAKLGYWVYLPPFGSRREADAATDMLKKRGVKDIYVVADEANRNAVSLGVFNQKDGATQREKEIRKLGLKPQMAERFRDEPRYWLDARGNAPALPEAEAFKDLGEEGAPVGKASSSCGA